MKHLILTLAFLTCSLLALAQKGISYQAVILDPKPIEIPGQDITGQPFVNGAVSLKFKIFSSNLVQEFEEVHATQTDAYGMVNVLIGSVSQGAFSSLVWDSKQKSLQVLVSFDQGGTYTKVSEQVLTYNPYAIYAETASKLSETLSIAGGGTGATTAAAARTNLGLGNVDNTADVNKPISTATQAALDTKANANEVTTALATKANANEVTTALATKANANEVTTALATKANSAEVTTAIATKANASEVTTALATKANASDVTTSLATKANADEVTTALATKANAAEVNTALATKANASDVTTSLGLKEDVSNKANTPLGTSTSLYPTQNAVKTYVDAQIASATIPDADASNKGKIQLAGDLAGTAAAPTVPGLGLKADAAAVNTALNLKANTADITTALATKANSSSLSTVATSGDYNDLSNKPIFSSSYVLPTASATAVGGVKVGTNLSIDGTGVLSADLSAGNISGTVAVSKGGTGATTLTGLVKGSGTSALTAAVAGTDYQLPITLTTTGTGTATYSGTTLNIPTPASIPTGTVSGNMLYWDGTTWTNLPAGSSAQTLTFINGKPTWKGNTTSSSSIPVVYSAGQIWMDRNLGASQVATSTSDILAFGDYYQWGRNADGHQLLTSNTTTNNSSTDITLNGGLFILAITDWRSTTNDNLWQGVGGVNNPCPAGFRLPTYAEWEQERLSWTTNDYLGAYESPLKLPMAGLRGSDGILQTSNTIGNYPLFGTYWSSDPTGPTSVYTSLNGQQYGSFAWELIFYSRELTTSNYAKMGYNIKSSGRSVRCIIASPNNLQGVDLAGAISVGKGGTGTSSINGIVKGNGSNVMTAATSGVDYSSGTSNLSNGGILKNNISSNTINGISTNIGTLSVAVAGTDYLTPSSTHYIGTTSIANNRTSAAQALTGITSIDGNAANITATSNSTITSLPSLIVNASGISGTVAVGNGGTGQTTIAGVQSILGLAGTKVAIGSTAGATTQGGSAIAIGSEAGKTSQGQYAVAVGGAAGNSTQGIGAIAIGYAAGQTSQGTNSVAIGSNAAQSGQGTESVAIGYAANSTGNSAIGIGAYSSAAGNNSIAIGYKATTTAANTIQLGGDGVITGSTAITNVKTTGKLTAGTVTYPNAHNLTAGQVLTINATGTASWASPSSGGAGSGHYVGEVYGGGIVFYVTTGGSHGLIAAKENIGNTAPYDFINRSTDPTWHDSYNTTNGGNLFLDWRAPTYAQLLLLYNARNTTGLNLGSGILISSTNDDNDPFIFKCINFSNGVLTNLNGNWTPYSGRAIRSF